MRGNAAWLKERLQRLAHPLVIRAAPGDQQVHHEVTPGLAGGTHDPDDILGSDLQLVVHLHQISDLAMAVDEIAVAEARQPGVLCPCLYEPGLGISAERAILDGQIHQIQIVDRVYVAGFLA